MIVDARLIQAEGIVGRLMTALDDEGIRYCHWKSNETLSSSLLGIVDLDVLVDAAAAGSLSRVLSEAGFKSLVAMPGLAHPAIGNFLALDRPTGRLVHLHVYYRLVTGEGHLKGYHLPWEDVILSTRRFDVERGLYVADPGVEMILFMVRAALRLRTLDRLLGVLGVPYFRDGLLREFHWLKKRAVISRVGVMGDRLLGAVPSRRLLDMLEGSPSTRRLRAFRKSLGPVLFPYRRFGGLEAVRHRWSRELGSVSTRLSLKYRQRPSPSIRIPATGGIMIAFVGSDGSGKSTLAQGIVRWLSGKIDVLPVYFGSGDGPGSVLRWPLQLAVKLVRRPARAQPRPRTAAGADGEDLYRRTRPAWEAVGRVLWALALSYEKRRKLRRAWYAHERGMIVVCDRFPQNQVAGFMDGPLLTHWRDHRFRPLRALARWERVPYEWTELHPPDLVIRLDVSPEVALRRKPEMSGPEVRRRIKAARSLRYPPMTKVVSLDADRPLDDLILKARNLIWDAI